MDTPVSEISELSPKADITTSTAASISFPAPDNASFEPQAAIFSFCGPDVEESKFDCNSCIELAGWGNYQWRVVMLIGLAYLALAAGEYVATILAKVLVCEWGLSAIENALVPFVYCLFSGLGAIMLGSAADRFGRIIVLKTALVINMFAIIACAVSPTYFLYMIFTSVSGFFNGGAQAVLYVYMAEMVPKKSRSRQGLILKIFNAAGRVIDCLLAFFVMDAHNGWRLFLLCTSLLCVLSLVILMFCDESPRYLAISDRKDEAVAVLAKISKENGTSMPEGEMVVVKEEAHVSLYDGLTDNVLLRLLLWVGYPLICIIASVAIVQVISQNASGSGIPEMKTILRGIVIHNYLTWQTLVSKVIGLCFAMGGGLPIGKEGPFVHIACIMSTLLGKNVKGFKRIFANETRNVEMLAAACAVGVSCTFAAPIGGVLFSIEVTSTYFAVSNYWRGFFTAVCGSFVFRMMDVWITEEATITTLYPTNFSVEFPFDPLELVAFSLMGLLAGLGGATFVFMHRKIVFLIRKFGHKLYLHKNRFIYPCIVTITVMVITFPGWLGHFMGGKLTQKDSLNHMFSDQSWSKTTNDQIKDVWADPNIFVSLMLFIVFQFIFTGFCVSLPVPAGVFFPIFVLGAAFGRLVGEAMVSWFPDGIHEGHQSWNIQPGGYAVVGAAAFSGAVTHTISTSVIVFEMTGQISHIIPVMIAVLIANAAAQWLQPSIYDSIIQIKKLPYLPEITKHSHLYNKYVSDIMRSDIIFISYESTYKEVQEMLRTTDYRSFPIVENSHSMVFLGSIRRVFLERALKEALHYSGGVTNTLPSNSNSYSDLKELEKYGDRHVVDNRAMLFGHITRHAVQGGQSAPTLTTRRTNLPAGVSNADFNAWKEGQLGNRVDFSKCPMDGAPFQLVNTTSVYKTHSLFGLLSLSHAYVTSVGRLIGVVTLNEIQDAVEGRINLHPEDITISNMDVNDDGLNHTHNSSTIHSTNELDPEHMHDPNTMVHK